MTVTYWKWMRSLVGLESGCSCRVCGQSILDNDPFGMSEGVCAPCRRG